MCRHRDLERLFGEMLVQTDVAAAPQPTPTFARPEPLPRSSGSGPWSYRDLNDLCIRLRLGVVVDGLKIDLNGFLDVTKGFLTGVTFADTARQRRHQHRVAAIVTRFKAVSYTHLRAHE